ncbi:MAG: DUF642 domain-containing protein [Phycisphaerae bacterium]
MFFQSHFTILFAAAAVAALGAMASTASANMIVNGDFSVNAAAYTASFGYDGAAGNPAAPSSWTGAPPANYGGLGVNGPDTAVGNLFAPGTSDNVLPPVSGAGSQDFAFLEGGATSSGALSPASFSQTFSTIAGARYVVTFEAAQRGADSSQGHEDIYAVMQVQVTAPNNSVLATATSNTGGGLTITDNSWANNLFNFTADATSATLTFADAPNSAPGETVDFTNVNVVPVPEPSALGLMAISSGFGMLLLKRRRTA